jgi:hypothetical protein
MVNLSRVLPAILTATLLAACQADRSASPPPPAALDRGSVKLAALSDNGDGGAIVLNAGEGKPDSFCYYAGGLYTTTQSSSVRTPSGNVKLSCEFEGLPPIAEQETQKNWLCTLTNGGFNQTRQSQWVRTPEGSAHLTCEFSGKPANDAAVFWGDASAAAQQGSFTTRLGDIPGQRIEGEIQYVGLGCAPIATDLSGRIALIERGVCAFSVKVQNAMDAGAVAAIVYNSPAFGDQIIDMGGLTNVGIPAVFVGRSTGIALASSGGPVTITYCNRSASCRGSL